MGKNGQVWAEGRLCTQQQGLERRAGAVTAEPWSQAKGKQAREAGHGLGGIISREGRCWGCCAPLPACVSLPRIPARPEKAEEEAATRQKTGEWICKVCGLGK